MKVLIVLSLVVAVVSRLSTLEEGRQAERKLAATSDKDWCDFPVRKAPVKFPESIVGRAELGFDMNSGYVNVTKHDYLYYWQMSTQDTNEKAPLIIWTNGGPGCSAMEAATTENGPLSLFKIKESCTEGKTQQCDYTNQLSTNKYSWNAHANLVYIDQPRFVGNSGGDSQASAVHSSVDAAADFVTFYRGLIDLFPEYKGKDLIIAGESYGGHYIPAFAQAILNENNAHPDNKIPLAGVIIGNGCVDDAVQDNSKYVDFLHTQKLIPDDKSPSTRAKADQEMEKHIGYTPNYYDYRLESINCRGCFGYNYNAWSHWFIQSDVKAAMNVCGNAGDNAFAGTAGGCINVMPFDANDNFDYSGALAKTLDAGIPVTFYYGKQDTACNYVGGYAMAQQLPWGNRDEFVKTKLQPMEIAGSEVGQMKTVKGLTWMQIEMAGHMVGLDEGAASSAALETLVKKYRL